MKLIYTTIFALILTISSLQAQNNDPFEGMDLFQELFGNMMNEMGHALEDSKMHMEQFELQDLGDGRMYIEGDTVNISGMFKMLSDNMRRMPQQMRPDEEHLDNIDETAKVLPDLLMKSAEMFKSGSFEQIFEEMFNGIGIEMPDMPNTPRNPNLKKDTDDEPQPTRPKGEPQEEKKPLKKMKHRKTIQI